jgi:hypothetical protein
MMRFAAQLDKAGAGFAFALPSVHGFNTQPEKRV